MKALLRLVVAVVVLGPFVGCGSSGNEPASRPKEVVVDNPANEPTGPPDLGELEKRHRSQK